MNGTEALHRGRAAFRAQVWREASTQLSAADQVAPLGGDDLERLAVSTYLAGNDAASVEAWTRAYTPLTAVMEHLDRDRLAALEREVVAGWQPWLDDGGLTYSQPMVTASARASR
jgi:hypothetical protein